MIFHKGFDCCPKKGAFLTYLTLSIDANIIRFIITTCSIDNFGFMTIIKAFSARHAIEFTWIWSFQVWYPFVSDAFEWGLIKEWALLMSEIWFRFGTVLYKSKWKLHHIEWEWCKKKLYLCVAREILLVTTGAFWKSIWAESFNLGKDDYLLQGSH